MSKFTPGPWKTDGDDQGKHALLGVYIAQDSESGGRIGRTFANCLVQTDEECRANARLIAAAPDLLSAAMCAVSVLTLLAPEVLALGLRADNVRPLLRAAIAKATGEGA